MAPRFGRIKYALNQLGMTGGVGAQYLQFVQGQANYTVNGRERGNDATVAIEPFGYDATDNIEALIGYSGRAAGALGTFGLSAAILGHITAPTGPQSIPGYQPARAVCLDAGATATTKTSQITGLQYKTAGGQSYTFPFGRVGTKGEFSVQSDIVQAVEATPKNGVTFKPERIYRG